MKGYLLDVNVLIALIDPQHVHHDRAHDWFAVARQRGWLSSPTTQNGVLRIVSHPRYANHQPMRTVLDALGSLLADEHHRFVPDSLSLVAEMNGGILTRIIATSAQITDTYLLALATANDARLATFDEQLDPSFVVGGDERLLTVP